MKRVAGGALLFTIIILIAALSLGTGSTSSLSAESAITLPLAVDSGRTQPQHDVQPISGLEQSGESQGLPPPAQDEGGSSSSAAQAVNTLPGVEDASTWGEPQLGAQATAESVPVSEWNPPPLPVPLARHPFDHYWFIRPLTSNYINSGLGWYPYGADGPDDDWRVHHGIDIANPSGTEVLAAGSGIVVTAGEGHHNEHENIDEYGNAISIRHDMGFNGEQVYTLYAHLSAIMVEEGQRVSTGEVIGLIGATGDASGPHVHFEVRIGADSYGAVRNPDLWLAPYSGTGVIAGRIEAETRSDTQDITVTARSSTSGEIVRRTTTYASNTVKPDEQWNENFVFPNIPTGTYEITAVGGFYRWAGEVTVREGMTNWVEMALTGAGR